MNFVGLIERKRDGGALTADEIREAVAAFTAGRIPDYQMAAWLMAVCFCGMTEEEQHALTVSMFESGDVLRFPTDGRPRVDKHSTGGVGDKVSLVLAPLLACLGFRVPMISGRGLGITGGTLDKLESIPGFVTALSAERIVEIVQSVGCVICGQTDRMAPADRRLYALRDVTGTVPSVPLIVGSILSKKLVEGLDALVLDVKFGAGAFMRARDQARGLAQALVAEGERCGVRTRALLSGMELPLGRAAGNWLEVKEAVGCLGGGGPADLRELTVECAGQLLEATGRVDGLEAGRTMAGRCLDSGEPGRKWREMLAAQGVDLDAYERKLARGTTAPVTLEVRAVEGGWVRSCDARAIGEVVRELGGGRLAQGDMVDGEVGVDDLVQPGERVRVGQVVARVHARRLQAGEAGVRRVAAAIAISGEPVEREPLVADVILGTG
jgi:pyrimidine-nucleoside phosphorylase